MPKRGTLMNEQPTSKETKMQNIAQQNKKMRKKLLIALGVTVGVVVLLISLLLIIKACGEEETDFELDESYFYPTYQGDIFEYGDYLDKRPDVILYCEDPDGLGRTTSIDADREDEFAPEVLFLRDFIQIMMHADVDGYNDCFNEIYYQKNEKQDAFSQQMIYEAEIRFATVEEGNNGEKIATYYLFYKLYENDGSLRRDVGSNAVVPMRVVLRTTPTGEISISEWGSTRVR
jgi:hypothetical protein